jgi:flavin-binding protein dodecin
MTRYAEGEPLPIVKVVEMIGESPHSWEDALHEVIAEAQKTLRGITRVAATDFDVRMKDDKIDVFRVRTEVSFRLEKDSSPDFPIHYDDSLKR